MRKAATAMRQTFPVPTSRRGGRAWTVTDPLGGFTLIEVLVAVTVLALVTAVLFRTLDVTLRSTDRADAIVRTTLEAERVQAERLLGATPAGLVAGATGDVALVYGAGVGAAGEWERWVVVPTSYPGLATEIYLGRAGRQE